MTGEVAGVGVVRVATTAMDMRSHSRVAVVALARTSEAKLGLRWRGHQGKPFVRRSRGCKNVSKALGRLHSTASGGARGGWIIMMLWL